MQIFISIVTFVSLLVLSQMIAFLIEHKWGKQGLINVCIFTIGTAVGVCVIGLVIMHYQYLGIPLW